ncbi:hypothetical protein MHYP_G00324700 [Metynnis hypsauchen]
MLVWWELEAIVLAIPGLPKGSALASRDAAETLPVTSRLITHTLAWLSHAKTHSRYVSQKARPSRALCRSLSQSAVFSSRLKLSASCLCSPVDRGCPSLLTSAHFAWFPAEACCLLSRLRWVECERPDSKSASCSSGDASGFTARAKLSSSTKSEERRGRGVCKRWEV